MFNIVHYYSLFQYFLSIYQYYGPYSKFLGLDEYTKYLYSKWLL